MQKDGKELRFSMVDGDFKRYVGRWYLRPSSRFVIIAGHWPSVKCCSMKQKILQ